MRAIAGAILIVAGALAGCSDPELKVVGEACVASSECAAGLVCDLGGSPPVCADHITTDARVIDAGLDARTDAPAVDAMIDAAPALVP